MILKRFQLLQKLLVELLWEFIQIILEKHSIVKNVDINGNKKIYNDDISKNPCNYFDTGIFLKIFNLTMQDFLKPVSIFLNQENNSICLISDKRTTYLQRVLFKKEGSSLYGLLVSTSYFAKPDMAIHDKSPFSSIVSK